MDEAVIQRCRRFLKEGIAGDQSLTGARGLAAKEGDGQAGKLSWDKVLST